VKSNQPYKDEWMELISISSHFLYNSLDSLSVLIDEDPQKAEAFVDEMSKIYRYKVQNGNMELNTLANEIRFIRSYFYLLKTRYGQAIELTLGINNGYLDRFVPTHALQVLVDNAIRENSLLKEIPLRISIETTSCAELVIRNNLQPKIRITGQSNGIHYIRSRYKLANAEVRTDESPGYLSVILPLLYND
jgi:LytS/YehU family sensor histidine kinase